MNKRQIVSLLLLAAMLATTACGGTSNDTPGNDDTTPQGGEDTTPVAEGYDYGDHDFNNYEFKILNLDEQFNCYIRLDYEEQTGEQYDDAVYDRNRFVEEKLNFTIKEIIMPGGSAWETSQVAVADAVIQNVMSDDDEYDAAYVTPFFKPGIVSSQYLLDLSKIPEMNVYEEYWDASINEELTLNDSLYIASGPFNMMTLDLSWALLFNEDMMDNNQLEYPYQLVRDGKWTLDKMNEYVSASVNLNGDDSFQVKDDGNCIYAMSAHTTAPIAFLHAANIRFYERDANGETTLTLGTDSFYTALEKIAKMCTIPDGKITYKNDVLSVPTSYLGLFANDRSQFITCELKSAMELRSMESSFGLVPMPKLTEDQEGYHSLVTNCCEFLAIPVTQDDASRAGLILDALTYESWEDVLPIYYDITVSQKGLRNEDSIEMMKIIRDNRSIDFMSTYKISGSFTDAIGKIVQAGSGDVSTAASTVATHETSVMTKLEEFLGSLEG